MQVILNPKKKKSKINRNIYGHFSEHLGRCIYGGLFVGKDSEIPNIRGIRKDVLEALRKIRVPVLRWPGGCFADNYHWTDGIGPVSERKKLINVHWGGVVEDNSFGTHEFMDLCDLLGCEPYVNGNVGSGSVQEMSEWVEYMTFDGVSPMAELRARNGREAPWKLKYFGIGNENWGCGGNMRPEYYADVYRRFATYVRDYGENKIFKIACGPNGDDYDWTEKVMAVAGRFTDAVTLHYYTIAGESWEKKGRATGFDEASYYKTLKRTLYMDELIENHSRIMDRYDPEKKTALIVDEWGTWYEVEEGTNPGFLYQQNTMRDAMVAALNLIIFNRHADRVRMANIAQTVNVLQAVILTDEEKMLLTPTYHVFDLFKEHQDARLIEAYIESPTIETADGESLPQLYISASEKDGTVHMTPVNISAGEEAELVCKGDFSGKEITARLLTADFDAFNDFSDPEKVTPRAFSAFSADEKGLRFTLPPCSIAAFSIR